MTAENQFNLQRETPLPPEIVLPPLDRKFALMYLVARLGRLTETDIVKLADILYHDAKQNRIRSLKDVIQEAGFIPKTPNRLHMIRQEVVQFFFGRSSIVNDAFLNHALPVYSLEEMEIVHPMRPQGYPPTGKPPTEDLSGYIDFLAGSGPRRPLLKELHLLSGLGEVEVHEEEGENGNQSVFVPTWSGTTFAEAIKFLYERPWKPDYLILLHPSGQEISHRTPNPIQI